MFSLTLYTRREMNGILLALSFLMFVAIMVVAPADGAPAILFALPLAAVAVWAIYKIEDDRRFLFRLFVSALLVRILVGTLIYAFGLQEFFGGDALTYDFFGNALVKVWEGNKSFETAIEVFSIGGASSGWGMLYLVGVIYKVVGRNMLAVQTSTRFWGRLRRRSPI